ncbi:Serine/threonine-protein kinase AfsK [Phycisphaerae bacterium RAS1]|nr:Serine/threonine-protein kinase AfsK [Phycisphaerae bacterium RAS1]
MTRVAALIGILALAAGGARAAGGDYLSPEALDQAGWVKYWQLALPLERGQRIDDAYQVDDQLYFGTSAGYCIAVHVETGAIRWLRPVTNRGYRIRRPCHAGRRVVLVSPRDILQLDRRTGEEISRRELDIAASTPPATDGARVFFGSLDRRFYSYTLAEQFELWKAGTAGPITSGPAIHGDDLFVASSDGAVYACDRRTKAGRWMAYTFSAITADLVVDETAVYAASTDDSLYAFDLLTGRERWRARFSGPLRDAPLVARAGVFQYSAADGLSCVDATPQPVDDRVKWTIERGRHVAGLDARHALVLTRDGALLACDLADGRVVQELPAGGFGLAASSADGSTMVLVAGDGRVFCARPRGARPPSIQAIRDALAPRADDHAPTSQPAASQPAEPARAAAPQAAAIGGRSQISKQMQQGGAPR